MGCGVGRQKKVYIDVKHQISSHAKEGPRFNYFNMDQ